MNPEWFKSQRVLQCLGDESRFRVMTELVRGDRCVTELATLVGLSQSCTTRHLQVLDRVGLVSSRRLGKRVVFCVRDEPRVVSLLAWALPMDFDGDVSRTGSAPAIKRGRAEHFAAGTGLASQPIVPEHFMQLEVVQEPAETPEARPENGSRGERAMARELEDFLL